MSGNGKRLARQFAADALADAIERALTPPEVAARLGLASTTG